MFPHRRWMPLTRLPLKRAGGTSLQSRFIPDSACDGPTAGFRPDSRHVVVAQEIVLSLGSVGPVGSVAAAAHVCCLEQTGSCHAEGMMLKSSSSTIWARVTLGSFSGLFKGSGVTSLLDRISGRSAFAGVASFCTGLSWKRPAASVVPATPAASRSAVPIRVDDVFILSFHVSRLWIDDAGDGDCIPGNNF